MTQERIIDLENKPFVKDTYNSDQINAGIRILNPSPNGSILHLVLEEVEHKCNTCDDTRIVVENAGCCGGCDQCGSSEEKEVPCPDCSLPEEDSEPLDD